MSRAERLQYYASQIGRLAELQQGFVTMIRTELGNPDCVAQRDDSGVDRVMAEATIGHNLSMVESFIGQVARTNTELVSACTPPVAAGS